jgi:hypothetical protein
VKAGLPCRGEDLSVERHKLLAAWAGDLGAGGRTTREVGHTGGHDNGSDGTLNRNDIEQLLDTCDWPVD